MKNCYKFPQVGTELRYVRKIPGSLKKLGSTYIIDEIIDKSHLVIKPSYEENDFDKRYVIARSDLEDGFFVHVKKWSEWYLAYYHNMEYRVQGERIQGKRNGIRVIIKCHESDEYDLKRGIAICAAKLDLAEAKRRLKKLTIG